MNGFVVPAVKNSISEKKARSTAWVTTRWRSELAPERQTSPAIARE
jgi:hypothetical protein